MIDLGTIIEICDELSDASYPDKIHGQYSAYAAGCRGILCRKYNRDEQRKQYRRANPEVLRQRSPRNPELDVMLTEVIAAHAKIVLQKRAEETAQSIIASAS